MKVLPNETSALLDKLYNLRGENSYILVEMEKEREIAEETKEKTAKEKEELQEKITSLTNEETLLAEQGAHLRDVLSGINPDDFKVVLDKLNIDFDPEALKNKIDETLPGRIEEVVSAAKEAEDELVKVEEEMNSAVTKIDELAIRKETELANQEKLNEYFELALNGNINITREAITSLVSQFNFNEEEQREAAKLMMFPEDALYEYDKQYQDAQNHGKSISDVLIEAKESVAKPIGEIFSDVDNTEEEKEVEEPVEESEDVTTESNDDIEKISSEISEILKKLDSEESKPLFDDVKLDDLPLNGYVEEPKEEEEKSTEVKIEDDDEETMMDLFKRLGLSEIMFVESELSDLIALDDKKIVEKNVGILNKYGINLDVVSDNVNILSDPELDEKINTILETGKTVDDIYFNPSVIKKYDYQGLKDAIELLKENGLDPKKVPLMAF